MVPREPLAGLLSRVRVLPPGRQAEAHRKRGGRDENATGCGGSKMMHEDSGTWQGTRRERGTLPSPLGNGDVVPAAIVQQRTLAALVDRFAVIVADVEAHAASA